MDLLETQLSTHFLAVLHPMKYFMPSSRCYTDLACGKPTALINTMSTVVGPSRLLALPQHIFEQLLPHLVPVVKGQL